MFNILDQYEPIYFQNDYFGCSAFRNFFRQKTIRQFYISQNVYSATFYSEIVKKQRTIRKRTKLAKSPFRYAPFGKIYIWQNLIKKLFIPKSSIPK